jgi:hypothetical protein
MIKRVVVLQGALLGVLALGSCKSDPTNTDVGTAAAVAMEFKLRTMAIGDSVRTFAQVVDKFSHPLQEQATIATACTPGILSLSAASDAPQARTAFVVKAVGYGTSCVVASASGFSDTLTVTTVPASLVVTGGPDSIASGATVNYGFAYKSATGAVLSGIPDPTLESSDTTIAQTGANLGDVSGRAPGAAVLTFSGTAGLSATKNVTVVAAAFTGTATANVDPGAILTIHRNPAGPVFDANTATSAGSIIAASRSADSIQVRVADLASAGAKTFSLTGVGPNDIAYGGGTYSVNAPAAFGGAFAPATISPIDTITVTAALGDPPFDSTTMKVFKGTSVGGLAAVTPVKGSVTATSFKFTTTDLTAGGTYLIQITRLGPTNLARRGSYTVTVANFTGTAAPDSGVPGSRLVLHRGGSDPVFDADSRIFIDGIRTFVDAFSADTAVVAIPPVGHTGALDLLGTRLGAAQQATESGTSIRSVSGSLLDATGHSNSQPNFPIAVGNGNTYLTLVGTCPGGVPANGGEKCDAYFTITNNTAAPDTMTVTASWFAGSTDGDLLICDGSALATGGVPACGNFAGGADIFDCACSAAAGDGFALADGNGEGPPEFIMFELPAGATYVIWVNMFDPGGAAATLIQLNVTGLK